MMKCCILRLVQGLTDNENAIIAAAVKSSAGKDFDVGRTDIVHVWKKTSSKMEEMSNSGK